jgi:hypothetical protein
MTLVAPICLALAWASVSGATETASRPAWKDCDWKPLHSQALGISLLVQDCKDPNSRYVYSVVGNRIEQHRPADDRTYNGPRMIEVYTKPAGQGIEAAIAKQFIAKLPRVARRSCRVVAYGEHHDTKPRYTIEPTGAYAKKIHSELADHPRDFGCGDYGRGQSNTYFEYHPSESRTRFAFVDAGQDEPLFDEESLQFER